MRSTTRLATLILSLLTISWRHDALAMDWTTVGNPGNPGDSTGYGAVPSAYDIGKYEVTNAQYVEFLNAKAATDLLTLYNTSMATSSSGGITRSGSAGTYTYSVKSGYSNKPVTYVNCYDAMRFANWMDNGQASGDTETGAYTLLGSTPIPSNSTAITRNAGALVFLPDENEWYKAAYYDPTKGPVGGYWSYATQSDSAPTADLPPGGSNSANFFNPSGLLRGLTDIGTFANSASYYGTFDQDGNVFEWTDTGVNMQHVTRGGSWNNMSNYLSSSSRDLTFSDQENVDFGFRLASVPEPSGLFLLGLLAFNRRSRTKKRAHPPRIISRNEI